MNGATVTVLSQGTLTNGVNTFGGWKNSSGYVYNARDTFYMGTENVTLSAQWTLTLVPGAQDGCFSDDTISKNLDSSTDNDSYYTR